MAQPIFRLDTGPDGLATLTFDLPGRRVNLFTREALEELAATVEALGQRRDLSCLIFLSTKRDSFCHGVDVDLLAGLDGVDQATAGSRAGQDILLAWERLPFPTIAAIESTCMGGGTELAVASTYRLVADRPDLRIGLPEMRLGILPAWGGCVRLPRLIGLEEALGMILTAKSIPPAKALRLGLADALLPADGFRRHAREFALARVQEPSRRHSEGDLRELLLEKNPLGRRLLLDQARKRALERSHGRYPAPGRTLEVLRVALEKGPKAGFEAEARALGELATDRVSKNLIHGFRLAQAAKKSPPPAAEARAIERVGVLGSGVMGTGIAHLVAVKAALPVRLYDNDPLALCRSLQQCALLTRNRLRRGRLSAAAAAQILARLEPSLHLEGFGRVELVLEAVTEDPTLKTEVLQAVAARVPATTILATNTSSLSIDSLAAAIDGPERFVGLHFFNPVHQVPLVEVVAGSHTSASTLAAAEAFVRRLGKTPLRVRDRPGFLVNRLLSSYLTEALWLFEAGNAPDALDAVMVDWGFPVGPFELIDRIGIDLALAVARRLADTFPHRLVLPRWNWQKGFLGPGFLGLKSGRGFYRYDQGQKQGVDPDLTSRLDLPPARRSPDPLAVVDRLILPMVNEAAAALAEDLVDGPATVDLAMLLGAGFPPFRGGLCRWADQEGPATVVQVLDRLAGQVGERFAPTQALRDVARRGSFYGPSSLGV